MTLSRGDVVIAIFPFTDGSGSKKRPGVVVQCDDNNRRLNAVILALITSNTKRAALESTQTLIDISTADGAQSGLLHASAVKCEHLLTIHHSLVDRVIGRLPSILMHAVDECLAFALELN